MIKVAPQKHKNRSVFFQIAYLCFVFYRKGCCQMKRHGSTMLQSNLKRRAKCQVALAIPQLLLELNHLVFGYYGFIDHAFFFGDETTVNFVVSLCQSGVGISGNTILLWATQTSLTPFAKLMEVCSSQVWRSLSVARNANCLVEIPPSLVDAIKTLEKREGLPTWKP